MCHLIQVFYNLFRREEGQTLTEYGLIIALVSIALVAGLIALAGGITNVFNAIIAAFNAAL